MPKNNGLKPVKLPMAVRFGEKPTTEFKNNLDAINLELVNYPTMDDLRTYIPRFLNATWTDDPHADDLTLEERDNIIRDCFFGKSLPTALETINLTYLVEGISLQEVTHLLRYRSCSFSADCSGDKWWTHKDALVPNSIQNSNGKTGFRYKKEDDFHARYREIVEMSKQLYCDMIDSKQISIMDARYILPRCLSTFYYMRISLKDAISFIRQRIDKQIQPETDNLIAYLMYVSILSKYPIANGLVDISTPSSFYVKMARTGKATNLYFPDEDSDIFEWNEKDFIYQCKRNELNGTDPNAKNSFDDLYQNTKTYINQLEALNKKILKKEYKEYDKMMNECDCGCEEEES